MPTRIPTQPGLGRIEALARHAPGSTPIRTSPPWGGFIDSVNRQLLDQKAFLSGGFNIVPAGEVLTYDYGWLPLQGAINELPLGGVGHTFGTDPGQHILAFMRLNRLADQEEEMLAITANNGATDGTLFSFGPSGEWEEIVADTDAIEIEATDAQVHHAIYPLAQAISGHRGIAIWTTGNGTGGQIYYYPDAAGEYALLPLPTADPFDLTPFTCRSLCVSGERLHFFNTVENHIAHPQRWRWTIPSWSTVAASNLGGATSVGSGAMDITDVTGEGLRIMQIGERIVLYFTDGVVLAERTGNPNAPYRKRTVTTKRGLLGENAVVDVGGGVHFGAFTDGFFLFTENGEWQEVGTTTVEGAVVRKFTDAFFNELEPTSSNYINVGFSERRRFAYIGWPAKSTDDEPNTTINRVWMYDMRGDRMWPLRYTVDSVDQYPTTWANFRSGIEAELAWEDLVGSWEDLGATPWYQFGASFNEEVLAHGTSGGMVWLHTPRFYTRNGTAVSYALNTHVDFQSPYMEKSWLRRAIQYQDYGGNMFFTANVEGSDPFGRAVPLLGNADGKYRVARFDIHRTGAWFEFYFVGAHPVAILGWEDEVVGTTGEALDVSSS